MVPSEAIFYKLFRLKEEKKAFKQKKILLNDFENITGELSASVCETMLRTRQWMLIWHRFDMDISELSARISHLSGIRMP